MTNKSTPVMVGEAFLAIERRRSMLRPLYWLISALAIVLGLHDGYDYSPMDVVVRNRKTSAVIYKDGPYWGFESAQPVLEVFAEEIANSSVDGFMAARKFTTDKGQDSGSTDV